MSKLYDDPHEYWAKSFKGVTTGRISSKKPNNVVSETEFRAEKAKLAKNQAKAHKNAQKATNDAELARREVLYTKKGVYDGPTFYPKTIVSTPNPNAAFRHKKGKARMINSVTPGPGGKFIVPNRYKEMYDDMIARGNSVQYTIVCIKDYIAGEDDQKAIPTALPPSSNFIVPKRFKELYDDMMDAGISVQQAMEYIKARMSTGEGRIAIRVQERKKKQAASDRDTPPGFPEKVRKKVWSATPGRWEYEDEE